MHTFLQNGCSNCVVKAGNAIVILLLEAMMLHPVPLESMRVWEKTERWREGRNRSRVWEVKSMWCQEQRMEMPRFFTFNTHTVIWLSLDSTYFNAPSFYLSTSFDGVR